MSRRRLGCVVRSLSALFGLVLLLAWAVLKLLFQREVSAPGNPQERELGSGSRVADASNPGASPGVTTHRGTGTRPFQDIHPQAALGIPSDSDASDDILLDRSVYLASYHPGRRVANWVSWTLRASDLGNVPRSNRFEPDRLLPRPLEPVTAKDYSRSGYDRGHLCPSKDRSDSRDHNAATFLMINIHPQYHELNAGPWEELESHTRSLAGRGGTELSVIAGGIFSAHPPTLGSGVAVPDWSYKLIVVRRSGVPLEHLTPDTPVISVLMPNSPRASGRHWADFLISVAELERKSGYDFLAALPDGLERQLEAKRAPPP